DYGDHLPHEASELLERQALAAARLGRLIDDLLRMARLTREEARRQEVDVTRMGREVSTEALDSHPGSEVVVEVQEGMTAQADLRLFRLALGNLIENAVKYSPNGGTVRVGQREDGAFFVSDEGIGIDPRYFGKVFEPFQRLHRDDEFSGTGIGLSNVQQIIARHGGKVWVESELGKGSTFLFTLG
ncbi:histidine kinase, partial [bacterium]